MWFQLAFAMAFTVTAFISKEYGCVFIVGAAICTGIADILLKLEKRREG